MVEQSTVKKARQFGLEDWSEEEIGDLKEIADKSGIDFQRICINADKEQEADQTAEEIIANLDTRFSRASTSDADEFRGLILGYDTSNGDIYSNKKEQRRKIYNDDEQKAINRGLTDEDGNALFIDSDNGGDTGEKIPEAHILNVYGIGEKVKDGEGTGDVRFFELTSYVEGDRQQIIDQALDMPIGSTVSFMANDSNDGNDMYDLRFTGMTMDSLAEVDINMPAKSDLYNETMSHMKEDMGDIRKKRQQDILSAGNTIVLEGYVSDVSQTQDGGKRIIMAQAGAGDSVTLLVPDYMEVDCGVGADIKVLGNLWIPSTDDPDEEPELLINLYDLAVEDDNSPDNIKGLDDEDEDEEASEDAKGKFGASESEDEENTEDESDETQSEDSSETVPETETEDEVENLEDADEENSAESESEDDSDDLFS